MNSALVVAWILGGNALALIILNGIFSGGRSSMGEGASIALDSRSTGVPVR